LPEERHRLVADQREVHFGALVGPLLDGADRGAEHVHVEAAGEAAVGRHDDHRDAPGRALERVRVLVLEVGVRELAERAADGLVVRPRVRHAVGGLAHLRHRDLFHRPRDLLRVLHALDLGADFLGAGH
jgi:hypothetical protein